MSDDGKKADMSDIWMARANREEAEEIRASMLSVVEMKRRLEVSERDLATARRQLGEVTADRDAILSVLAAKPGAEVAGYKIDRRAASNEVFVFWVNGEGNCISLNNLVGQARKQAAPPPTTAPTPAPADPVAAVLAVPCPICCARAWVMCVEYVSEYEVADARGICPERLRAASRHQGPR